MQSKTCSTLWRMASLCSDHPKSTKQLLIEFQMQITTKLKKANPKSTKQQWFFKDKIQETLT